jgi:hypothetical protein
MGASVACLRPKLVPVCPDIVLKVGKKREIFRSYPLLQLFKQSLCQGGAMIGIYGDSSMHWQHYLWRAADQDGEVVDVFLQAKRDGAAAKCFFKRLLRSHGGVMVLLAENLYRTLFTTMLDMPTIEETPWRCSQGE